MATVFISSTSEDLKEYRKAAERAASRAGFRQVMMEDFAASGRLPLDVCREKVSEADVLVVIVAHRYGWVPPGQPPNQFHSITWLECEEAARQGKEVLAFLVDPACEWPLDQREAYRITAAIKGSREVRFALLGILCDAFLLHLRSRYNDPQNTGQEGQSADGDGNCG